MAVQFLFDSKGMCIAFRIRKYIFNTNGYWIGWLPWNDKDVVTPEGKYLGAIVKGDHFYYSDKQDRGYPGYPG
jgi:hypothetical protein